MNDEVAYLYYSEGEYEDYEEVPLFYGTPEFINQKHKEYTKFLNYLEYRAQHFTNKFPSLSVEEVLLKYLKAIFNYEKSFLWSIPRLGTHTIKSYNQFIKELK